MSEGRILFQGPIKEIWKDEEDSTGLSRVLTEQAQYFRDLRFEGKTWEEARKLTDEKFDPIIEKILYPKGRPEKKKIKLNQWYPYFGKPLGMSDHKFTIQGRVPYKRLFIQTKFRFRFVLDGQGIYAEIDPNKELYPNGIEITEQMKEWLSGLLDEFDFELDLSTEQRGQ